MLANSRTHDLEVGKAGQVVVQDIKWVREPDGTYKIAVIEISQLLVKDYQQMALKTSKQLQNRHLCGVNDTSIIHTP